MTRGLVLGKFLPPHLGHQFLVDFARHHADELTVLVCSLSTDPVPGTLRFEWMRRLFPYPSVRLVHVADDSLPQTPDDHPDFWPIWRNLVHAHVNPVDFVYASEPYGHRLASELSATFIPVDPARELLPVSGTAVRRDPLAHWDLLPEIVRSHYLKRVCLFGPESTGKTTLARDLASHYATRWVHEHARPLLDSRQGVCGPEHLPLIVRGQHAAEDAMAPHARRVLFCDTDALLTAVWARVLFGRVPDAIERAARSRNYDLYLLTDIDVPWVDDGQRYLPHRRREFFDLCESALRQSGRPYVKLSGPYDIRRVTAVAAVDALLASRH